MNKQVQAIRAEIERLYEYFKGKEDDAWDDCDNYTDEDAFWYQGHWKMCAKLLTLIDSLPDEKPSKDLEEAANEHIRKVADAVRRRGWDLETQDIADAFIEGAQWQKKQMLKDAVEGEVCGRVRDHINVRFADGVSIYLEPKNISHIPADISKYAVGDRVKIVIVPIKEE